MCLAGLPNEGLKSLCPNVVDLDLSDNLLGDWGEILSILEQLPCLKFVSIARNVLNDKNVSQRCYKYTTVKINFNFSILYSADAVTGTTMSPPNTVESQFQNSIVV